MTAKNSLPRLDVREQTTLSMVLVYHAEQEWSSIYAMIKRQVLTPPVIFAYWPRLRDALVHNAGTPTQPKHSFALWQLATELAAYTQNVSLYDALVKILNDRAGRRRDLAAVQRRLHAIFSQETARRRTVRLTYGSRYLLTEQDQHLLTSVRDMLHDSRTLSGYVAASKFVRKMQPSAAIVAALWPDLGAKLDVDAMIGDYTASYWRFAVDLVTSCDDPPLYVVRDLTQLLQDVNDDAVPNGAARDDDIAVFTRFLGRRRSSAAS